MTSSLQALFASDPDRAKTCRVSQGGWILDYSHVPISPTDAQAMTQRFDALTPAAHIEALFSGAIVNPSENQPAKHMALRSPTSSETQALAEAFLDVAQTLYSGQSGLTDLIHIGIGGSDLGPRLVAHALDAGESEVEVHWLSTVDGRRLHRLLRRLDPKKTGVVIASKSFSTEETLVQASIVKAWLGDYFVGQAWAATANPERAEAFGIAKAQVLAFPQWTGGRFSLWSSVGVSAAASVGVDAFKALLAGAHEADICYQQAANGFQQSLAVWMGWIIDFLRRDLDLNTLGVVSYEPRLALLGDYCQQLFMESLGKRVDREDVGLDQPTVPLIFGGRGTDLQHSIFQALHQGLDTHPLLLVGSLRDPDSAPDLHRVQLAHLLAQRQAFLQGRLEGKAYQVMPGNRPVAVLLTESMSPKHLGFLLASLEHAVFTLSLLWRVNPFDQWGVEEGKRLAAPLKARLQEEQPDFEIILDWAHRHH